ncbi:MAG: MBL fold metallo-hydrolase [Salibacteraceae bacterium]
MSELKVTFLGTGTSMGVPVIGCDCNTCKSEDPKDNRLRTSALIQKGDKNIVIDSGPDFRYQMLRSGIRSLEALIFTHEHKDHTAGMDDVRAFNFIQRRAVDVYASSDVEKVLRSDFHYAFADTKYPGVPEINIHQISAQKEFYIGDLKITPIQVYHHKMPVLGFRIEDFTYITDANYIPPEELKKIEGSKVLVLNALRQTKHISHFSLNQAVELVSKLAPDRAYLTHISHQMGKHKEVSNLLPKSIEISYDQQVVVV